MSVRERIERSLASPRAPNWAALVALLICLPSLGAGEFLDDHLMRAHARAGLPAWDRYGFVRPQQIAELREQGSFGWWSAEQLSLHFFRPISALTHALDYAIWPDAVWLMHLENALIYAALSWLVARLIQRVHGPGLIAGVAGLAFAIVESHAGSAYWISGRNTMLAAGFGVLAMLAHLRWREHEANTRWAWAVLASAAFGAALLSAEAGLCSFGYLLGWSLCCERGRVPARLFALAPYVAIIVIWRIAYVSAGFGASESSVYLDLGATPLLFALRSLVFSPALAFTTLSLPITELILARPWTSGVLAIGGVLLFGALAPILRADVRARAWLLGMLFAAVPLAATWPTSRLLPVLSIGGAALVGLVHHSWRAGEVHGRLRRAAYGLMLACNLVLAPAMFVFAGLSTRLLETPHRVLAAELLRESPEHSGPCLILNSPTEITNLYTKAIRERAGQQWPLPTYLLYVGIDPLEVVRTGDRTLELISERGWAGEQLDRFSRDWRESFVVGQRVRLEHAEVTVLEISSDGRPRKVRVDLDRSLDEVAIYGFGRADESGVTLDRWRPAIGEREHFRAGILR